MTTAQPGSALPSALPAEIDKFDRLAADWWDPAGPMAPLHAMNDLRTSWVDEHVRARAELGGRGAESGCRGAESGRRGAGSGRLLDIGCGAGLASEAFARLGYDVLGIDAAAAPIAAASAHAAAGDLPIAYRVTTAEALVAEGLRFPVITALEVIEHVADPARFLQTLGALLEPGGLLFITTLNRTLRSLAIAKVGAEYVARLLPTGTHDWRRFLSPADLDRAARPALRLAATRGMTYDLRARAWRGSTDLSVNYLAMLIQRA